MKKLALLFIFSSITGRGSIYPATSTYLCNLSKKRLKTLMEKAKSTDVAFDVIFSKKKNELMYNRFKLFYYQSPKGYYRSRILDDYAIAYYFSKKENKMAVQFYFPKGFSYWPSKL